MNYEEELEEQYNAIKKYQEKARKENYYQVDYANEITKLNLEKQQLISFLEDKIRETTPNIKANYYDEKGFRYMQYVNDSNLIMTPAHIVYQEVLDFINKGDIDGF